MRLYASVEPSSEPKQSSTSYVSSLCASVAPGRISATCRAATVTSRRAPGEDGRVGREGNAGVSGRRGRGGVFDFATGMWDIARDDVAVWAGQFRPRARARTLAAGGEELNHASHGLALGPHFTRASAARHRVAPDSRDPLQKNSLLADARVRAGSPRAGRRRARRLARNSTAARPRRCARETPSRCAALRRRRRRRAPAVWRAGGPGDETPRPGPRLTF